MSVEHDSLLLPAGAAEHVLIQLYSPHSDPCRRLVPHFEALAKRLVRPHVLTFIVVVGTTIIMNVCVRQAEHSDPVVQAVVVAAIDVDSNDTPAPYDNRGLPTVYLSSRGARGSPKQMEARTRPALLGQRHRCSLTGGVAWVLAAGCGQRGRGGGVHGSVCGGGDSRNRQE